MQQITFENWKQLGLKVGDPILIMHPNGYEISTLIETIQPLGEHDKQPLKFANIYDRGVRQWVDFRTDYVYYKMNNTARSELSTLIQNDDFSGYFYHSESNTIETRNVTPHKILKHSTNQNGERVWKLRGTWVTDTQIKNAINPPKPASVQNTQYMIATISNDSTSIIDQTIYTDVEILKQEMQKLALANPRNKYVAVQLTDIKVSLDLSNPVFKWD
jgi:hypothetical protein